MSKFRDGNLFLRTNTETLAATKTLTKTSEQIQILDGGAADRTVQLPPEADSDGVEFTVINTGATNVLNVNNDTPTLIKEVGIGQSYKFLCDGTDWQVLEAAGSGSGDVTGPASATDNAIARFDLTTGKIIQNSALTIADDGTLSSEAITPKADSAYGLGTADYHFSGLYSDKGEFTNGDGGTQTSSAGSLIFGQTVISTNTGELTTSANSFAGGYSAGNASSASRIYTQGSGDVTFGHSTGGSIRTDGVTSKGNLVFGYANLGSITGGSGALGSLAFGHVDSNSTISTGATAHGSLAGGYATSGYDIQVSGTFVGAIAFGNATSANIVAGASGAIQFGPGTNSEANSLQMGNTTDGVRLNAAGAPGSPHNGDIWVASTNMYLRSGGASVNVSNLSTTSGDYWSDAVDSDIVPTGADSTHNLGSASYHFLEVFSDRGRFIADNLGTQTIANGSIMFGKQDSSGTIVTATSSIAGGYAYNSTIQTSQPNSIAFGFSYAASASTGCGIYAGGGTSPYNGGLAFGRISTIANNTKINSSGKGSLAFGYASNGGSLVSSGEGSLSFGQATSANDITASGIGAIAGGHASTSYITASGDGSGAFGQAVTLPIQATATNSFQFGIGNNSEATSLQVGNTTDGIRLIGDGAAAASPANGDIWVSSNDIQIRSGGISRNLSDATKKSVSFTLFDSDQTVATGNGVQGFCVPDSMANMNLIDARASVYATGTTGTMDIQVRRSRAGTDADMLSIKVTVGSGEYTVNDETVDLANDDINAGDLIFIDVDTVHTTPATGLSVVLTFSEA